MHQSCTSHRSRWAVQYLNLYRPTLNFTLPPPFYCHATLHTRLSFYLYLVLLYSYDCDEKQKRRACIGTRVSNIPPLIEMYVFTKYCGFTRLSFVVW